MKQFYTTFHPPHSTETIIELYKLVLAGRELTWKIGTSTLTVKDADNIFRDTEYKLTVTEEDYFKNVEASCFTNKDAFDYGMIFAEACDRQGEI